MKTLAILGAGGHAKVVADAALCSGWKELVFFDTHWPSRKQVGSWKVVGNIESFFKEDPCFDATIIALGDNLTRFNLIKEIKSKAIPLAKIIHPSATLSQFAELGEGSVVFASAVINPDCQIGVGAIINTGATVDHDCYLGEGIHISPGAHLAGGVKVGNLSWVGIGATIRQQITIGAQVIIGAGAVVVKNVPDNCIVVGNPAKIMPSK